MTHGEIVADLEEAHPELLVNGSFPDEIYKNELHRGFEFSPEEEIVEDREAALERALQAGLLDHLSEKQIEQARKTGLQSVHLQKYLH